MEDILVKNLLNLISFELWVLPKKPFRASLPTWLLTSSEKYGFKVAA